MLRSLRITAVAAACACCAALLVPCASWALSDEDEVRVGRQVMEQVRPMGLTADPSLQRIGNRLRGVVKRKDLPWRFWVIEDWKTYNAFAAPGGFVFITRTYYEKLNDDEAAFVIGHEMAHVDLDHYERELRRSRTADIGHLLLNVLVGSGSNWTIATDIGASAYMTHYSRAMEKEADLTGYQYAQAAGYNASLAVTALSKLSEKNEPPALLQNLYGTHPLLSSREDRLAAIGGREPEEIEAPGPSPDHERDLTGGLQPFDPRVPIAVRILAPGSAGVCPPTQQPRWENAWRKDFTRRLHTHLVPHGFSIAGDDLMYKPDIGDPIAAARSRKARYLLLVTTSRMYSTDVGKGGLTGTPVRATVEVEARLFAVTDGKQLLQKVFAERREGSDVLPVDNEILYTDTCLGSIVDDIAARIGQACAVAAGAGPARPKPDDVGSRPPRPTPKQRSH